MNDREFRKLLGSLREVLAHAQGKRSLRTTVLPAPPAPMTARDIRKLRTQVNASQAVFAHALNVSTRLVQAWETGRRTADGAALRLLRLGHERPEVVFHGLRESRVALRRTARRRPA